MIIKTYASGFNLTVGPAGVSKGEFVLMCKALDKAFGNGNEFRPEPIGNGFIIWSKWPGKEHDGYKCIRLFPQGGGRAFPYNWPWIKESVMDEWDNNDETLLPAGKYHTFLKSFHSAPKWLRSELSKIKTCLEKTKKIRVGPLPAQKRLNEEKN